MDVRRFLEDTDDDNESDGNDSSNLRNTLRVYGGIFFILFIIFCCVRQRYPKTFFVRAWVEKHKTEIAKNQFGFINWAWKIFEVSDEVFQDECGMDALCLTRIQHFGWRISLVGMLNAMWLIPLYITAPTTEDTVDVTDNVVSMSVAHVPAGSIRLLGTTIGAYVIFGYTMYAIVMELNWFAKYRHRFLAKTKERNYTVYVRHIPVEYRSNAKLFAYFNQLFPDSVLIANVPVNTTKLQAKVLERDTCLTNLEHAINIRDVKGTTPMHSTSMLGGEKVDSIQTYTAQLEELNKEVDEMQRSLDKLDDSSPSFGISSNENGDKNKGIKSPTNSNEVSETESAEVANEVAVDTNGDDNDLNGDGVKFDAGFVSFTTLKAANAARQMVQHEAPFGMEMIEAPDPEDIIWANANKSHAQLQIGKLLSFSATSALCLFWTAIMAAVTALSTVEGLRSIGWISKVLDAAPFLVPILAQIAPLFVVVANIVLKILLELFSSMFEGPISGAVVKASYFVKLAWFFVIQNFFVIALSGGLISSYSNIIDNPTSAIDLLAVALASRSTFFIQILLVNVFLSLGLEVLQVVPVVIAYIRSLVGPNLTEKERNTTWLGLRPRADPDIYDHAFTLSYTVLYFMVTFVYSVIAPISSFFMAMCFILMGIVYRNQLIYIYPVRPDSGGQLFASFLSIVLSIMLVSQFVIVGLLGIKKSPVATACMFPLLIITVLFTTYVKQKHFSVADHLPGRKAIEKDNADQDENISSDLIALLQDAFKQPEIKAEKYPWPENDTSHVVRQQEDVEQGNNDSLLAPLQGSGDAVDYGSRSPANPTGTVVTDDESTKISV